MSQLQFVGRRGTWVAIVACLAGCGAEVDETEELGSSSEASCLGVKLTNLTALPLASNSSASLLASNVTCAPGEAAEYRFLYRREGATTSYTVFRDWDPSPAAMFDNSGLASGKYTLLVRARRAGSAATHESSASTTLMSGNVCTSVAVATAPPSPSPPTGTITLTPTATCTEAGGAEYLYQVKAPGSSNYADLTTWVSTAGSWNSVGLAPGTYTVRVLTRGAGNATTPFEGQRSLTYALYDVCKPVSISASPTGTASIGTVVHLSGGAPCVGSSTPEFRFSYRLKGAAAFSILQDYGSDSSVDWNTLNLSTGIYQVKVDARAPGAPTSQSNKIATFTLVPHNCPTGYQPDGSGGCGVTPSFALVGDSTDNYAVSADGTVFGGQIHLPSISEAARGMLAGGFMGIGRLQVSDSSSIVRGLSGDGAILVGSSSGAGTEAFRWSQATGMVGLGTFAGGISSTAWDISDDGAVICGSSEIPAATGVDRGFRWTLATGLVGLGTADPGYPGTVARSISADGSAIVGLATPSDSNSLDRRPFRWTTVNGNALLPLPPGATAGAAFGISADGQVVVGEVVVAGVKQGYRWSEATGPEAITNAPGLNLAFFTGTDADGSVAVGTGNLPSGSGAIIWDANNGSRLLQDVLDDMGVVVPAGWTLTRASAVSNDGHTIVGSAADAEGNSRAFVARL